MSHNRVHALQGKIPLTSTAFSLGGGVCVCVCLSVGDFEVKAGNPNDYTTRECLAANFVIHIFFFFFLSVAAFEVTLEYLFFVCNLL